MSSEKISVISFPANHLLSFQLFKNNDNRGGIYPEFFGIVGLLPGIVKEDGKNSYDFKNSINLKYSIPELYGLSWALKNYADGNIQKDYNYSKFSKKDAVMKVVSLAETFKEQQTKKGIIKVKLIQFRFSVNNVTKSVALTIDQAHGLAENINRLFIKACDLDLNRKLNNEYGNKAPIESSEINNTIQSDEGVFDGFEINEGL